MINLQIYTLEIGVSVVKFGGGIRFPPMNAMMAPVLSGFQHMMRMRLAIRH